MAHCEACNQFYHLNYVTRLCEENECTCNFGIPVENAECLEHQKDQCSSCTSAGHHLDEDENSDTYLQCLENVCQCEFGEPRRGLQCRVHDEYACTSWGCNTGYTYDVDTKYCMPNDCKCQTGDSPAKLVSFSSGQANPSDPNNPLICDDPDVRKCYPHMCDASIGYGIVDPTTQFECVKLECACENGVGQDPCPLVRARGTSDTCQS